MTNIDFENGFLIENHACVKKPLNEVLKEINLNKNERIIANLTLLKKQVFRTGKNKLLQQTESLKIRLLSLLLKNWKWHLMQQSFK